MTYITAERPSEHVAGRVFFERVLLPYRSLPPRGFNILMLVLAGISIAGGMLFVSLGAWPVCGFFGLDVGLVYLAFRLSYRSARQRETLRLGEDELTVERVGIRGDRRLWRFQPFWVRVIFEEKPDESNRLALASHGQTLPIGTFLPAPVRREVATTLRDALSRWRAALNPTQR
ncbi:MAG TPA: DUF2244 domain-containing protein [Stellaceae bacterium]|jgi:uncharacterized membrane protein|nr:DUF2244 domain-containing protein [Stellaceae bacterium]